ncbi:hypothetical protein AAC691_02770 [Nguyenibacter vanlangensis]|uniref:GNAT family N-acetyltransferase n=1 Tax=Nguyenibacter vanlangensis TaxID=1216886 RepID=A0ABZ3D6I5_9PROT
MTPHIRLARPDDLANVEAVVKAAYGHYVARLGRAPGPMLADYRTLIAARMCRQKAQIRYEFLRFGQQCGFGDMI